MTKKIKSGKLYLELQSAIESNGGVECSQVPDVFFPDDERDAEQRRMMVKVAKEVCSSCPVKLPCAAYAMSTDVVGIWGGTTPIERSNIRREVVHHGME